MKLKKILMVFLIWLALVGTLGQTAQAQNAKPLSFIKMEDMRCEEIDLTQMGLLNSSTTVRITGSINGEIPAHQAYGKDGAISLVPSQIITFNCSYSPSSVSMDFGVIAPDGYYYYINTRGGSINQSIAVSQRGDYIVAIRNNSSQTVRVVGFVDY